MNIQRAYLVKLMQYDSFFYKSRFNILTCEIYRNGEKYEDARKCIRTFKMF